MFPIPRMEDCADKIGNAQYVLSEGAKEISAFVTPNGLYQYKVMLFRMKNAPATFQRLINCLVTDIKGYEAFIDNTIVYSNNWKTHLDTMQQFFQCLSKANLTINLTKSKFGSGTVTYLRHIVQEGPVKPIRTKIKAISVFPPHPKKQVMHFLGMAG